MYLLEGIKNCLHKPFSLTTYIPQVLSMFKKLRVVEVRHLQHISPDNLLKCVVGKKIFLWSVSS